MMLLDLIAYGISKRSVRYPLVGAILIALIVGYVKLANDIGEAGFGLLLVLTMLAAVAYVIGGAVWAINRALWGLHHAITARRGRATEEGRGELADARAG